MESYSALPFVLKVIGREMDEKKTKLREAYLNLVGDYLIESVSALMLKEELEELLDRDLSIADFHYIIKQNAKVYRVFLFKHKPDDYGFIRFGERVVGEIGIETKEGTSYV